MKILVIEDAPTIQRAVIRVLRRMFSDARIEATDTADEAIRLLTAGTLDSPFDLVISDFNLVGQRTGGDVLEWIRYHASYLLPRFLFFTNDGAAAMLHDHFVEKPCDTATLRTAIEAVLHNTRS